MYLSFYRNISHQKENMSGELETSESSLQVVTKPTRKESLLENLPFWKRHIEKLEMEISEKASREDKEDISLSYQSITSSLQRESPFGSDSSTSILDWSFEEQFKQVLDISKILTEHICSDIYVKTIYSWFADQLYVGLAVDRALSSIIDPMKIKFLRVTVLDHERFQDKQFFFTWSNLSKYRNDFSNRIDIQS